MEQSQLVELIRRLDAEEQEQVLQFAAMTKFNSGKMRAFVPALLEICLQHPWEKDIALDKKEVYAKLFPQQNWIDGKLEKVMVEAHKVVKAVLLTNYYFRQENDFQQNLDFAALVRTRGMESRQQQVIAKLKKQQEETPHKNAKFYLQQFQLEYAIHEIESHYNQRKGDINILNVLESLYAFNLTHNLSLRNRFLLQKKVAPISVPDEMSYLIPDLTIPDQVLSASPVIGANYLICNLLQKEIPAAEDIRGLFNYIKNHETAIDDENLREFYTYLRNSCILILVADASNEGAEQMLNELYKDNLKRGYLHNEGMLTPSRYWAVSSQAIRLKDYAWAKEFIETYKDQIIGENGTRDFYRLNLANYLFAIGRYQECLDNIPPSSPFVDYMLTAKRLEIKAYYELESDLLSYKLDAFKVFLSRTSPKLLSDFHRKMHVEFVNLLTQICQSTPGDHKRSDVLIKRINEKKQAGEWRWLLEKAQQLKNPK